MYNMSSTTEGKGKIEKSESRGKQMAKGTTLGGNIV